MQASNLFGGTWSPIHGGPGDAIVSRNPAAPTEIVWSGEDRADHIEPVIESAQQALPEWARWDEARRFDVLRRFQQICKDRQDEMAALITRETGKAAWEGNAEASLLGAKVDVTLDEGPHGAIKRVRGFDVAMTDSRIGAARFKPHGVMLVLGPFNFPAHLPNGHIIPALATGNTIIFKPSNKTPAVGQRLAAWYQEALEEAGAPAGVMNLIHGRGETAASLVDAEGINGILFTGSWPVGRRILEANLDRPDRIIALEMGGNNPAVVMDDADLRQAVIECVRCAFITTGQRCTCTRRIILHEKIADRFISAFCKSASTLVTGPPTSETPIFMGPIVTDEARQDVLSFQRSIASAGASILMESSAPELDGYYVTPGVARVDRFTRDDEGPGRDAGCDREVFGPFARICTVSSLDEAIKQANATRFGLAASIFTQDRAAIERFQRECRAGCININAGTAGASSKLPFGGLGFSGNHRPAGAFSLDYCAYPVAGLIESGNTATIAPGMLFEDSWL